MFTHIHTPPRLIPLGFTPELYPEGTHICYLYSGGMIYELLNVHPVMIVHGQIMRNPFYVAPVENSGAQQQTR
jgi:hypothetical protein